MNFWHNIIKVMVFVALFCWISPWPVQASSCRTLDGQSVCILDIQRSAKNHWEYRIKLKIDQATRPSVLYNCRDRFLVTSDGKKQPFVAKSVGDWICHRLDR
jgi:hypothetical protein